MPNIPTNSVGFLSDKPPCIGISYMFPYIFPSFPLKPPFNGICSLGDFPAQAPRVDHRRQLLRAGRGARLGEPLPGDHHRCQGDMAWEKSVWTPQDPMVQHFIQHFIPAASPLNGHFWGESLGGLTSANVKRQFLSAPRFSTSPSHQPNRYIQV